MALRACGPPSAAVHRRETVDLRQRPGPVQRPSVESLKEKLRYSGRAAGLGRWLAAARNRAVTLMRSGVVQCHGMGAPAVPVVRTAVLLPLQGATLTAGLGPVSWQRSDDHSIGQSARAGELVEFGRQLMWWPCRSQTAKRLGVHAPAGAGVVLGAGLLGVRAPAYARAGPVAVGEVAWRSRASLRWAACLVGD